MQSSLFRLKNIYDNRDNWGTLDARCSETLEIEEIQKISPYFGSMVCSKLLYINNLSSCHQIMDTPLIISEYKKGIYKAEKTTQER